MTYIFDTTCPNCGKQISIGARYCPYCRLDHQGNSPEMNAAARSGGQSYSPSGYGTPGFEFRPRQKLTVGLVIRLIILVPVVCLVCYGMHWLIVTVPPYLWHLISK